MATSVRSSGRKVRLDHNHQNRSGTFFQQLAVDLFAGEPPGKDSRQMGDVYIPSFSLGIEVKAASTNDGARLRIEQKEFYENLHFPVDRFAYLVCCWRNKGRKTRWIKEKGKPRVKKAHTFSLMSRIKTKGGQIELMANKAKEFYLMDIQVINAITLLYPPENRDFPGREGEPHLFLGRRKVLWPLRNDFDGVMRKLGLDPQRWSLGTYPVEMVSKTVDTETDRVWVYPTNFTLYTVFPVDFHFKFQRRQTRILSRLKQPPPI